MEAAPLIARLWDHGWLGRDWVDLPDSPSDSILMERYVASHAFHSSFLPTDEDVPRHSRTVRRGREHGGRFHPASGSRPRTISGSRTALRWIERRCGGEGQGGFPPPSRLPGRPPMLRPEIRRDESRVVPRVGIRLPRFPRIPVRRLGTEGRREVRRRIRLIRSGRSGRARHAN